MPQSNSRANLNKLGQKTPPYFLFFILSIVFIALSLLAYNYALSRLSTQMAIYHTNNLQPTPNPTNHFQFTPTPQADATPSALVSPADQPTPTPPEPYLKSYQDNTLNFKVDYWSPRTLFEDHTDSKSRFVLVHSDGNFVVHIGKIDWVWVHSGRELTNKFKIENKPTFVFETTSQKIVDFNSDSGLFFTLQCVHNGSADLVKECDQFIKSFKFTSQSQ